MRNFLLLLLTSCYGVLCAQQITQRPNDKYGISPGIALPVTNGSYEAGVSFDASFYYQYDLGNMWKVSMPIGASLLNVEEHDDNLKYRQTNIYVLPSVRRVIPDLDGSSLVLGVKPYYALVSRESSRNENLVKQMGNRLGAGGYVGLDINLRANSTLELGYTYNFANNDVGFIDGAANHLSLKLNLNFNRVLSQESYKIQMIEGLAKLRRDTLYVINRMCPDDFSTKQLDSLFSSFYSFSAYRILAPEDIDDVVQKAAPQNFAVVGRYYKSEGDPETTGIYLLDGAMQLTKFPYPIYTYLPYNYTSKGYCFETLANLAGHILEFDRRLKEKSEG